MGRKQILVTGGAGYIGSTICSALADDGYEPVIIDNLCHGPQEYARRHKFYHGDINDGILLKKIFSENPAIDTCIHCAAYIVIPESVAEPEVYYRENVTKSIQLFSHLRDGGCRQIIFSSSASVYASSASFEVDEAAAVSPNSPYARSKLMMEMILQDFCTAYHLRGIALRYFNPIGADPKLRTGPYDKNPTHVLAKIMAAITDPTKTFQITGTDWPTRDGSGIRDYIHVWDLAQAHVKAVSNFDHVFASDATEKNSPFKVINIGTGLGNTVKELVAAVETVLGKSLAAATGPRRFGDVAGNFANSAKAQRLLGWKAELSLQDSIRSALAWAEKCERK